MSSTPQEGTYATGHDAPDPVVPGLVDPSWTRLAAASLAPVLLAASASLPSRARLVLVLVLVPLMAQGWSALVRARHDWGTAVVVGLTGVAAAVAVTLREDYGAAAVVMAFSVLLAFVGQMLRKDGRPDLVEDLSATVTGNLVVVSGAAWCALGTSGAHPAVTVPCALALVTGALLTVLEVRAGVLETLTMTLPALVAGQAQRPRGVAEGARHGPRVLQQEVLGLEDDRGAVRPADVALAHLTGGEAVKGDGAGEVEVVQAQAPRRGGLPAAGERCDGTSCQGQVEAVHEEAPAPGNGQARRGERVSHGGWSSCRGDCGWAALPGRRPLRARGRTLTG